MLVRFAVMGAAAEECRRSKSRAALLNIGEEETKGPDSIPREASLMLKQSQPSPAIGYLGGE